MYHTDIPMIDRLTSGDFAAEFKEIAQILVSRPLAQGDFEALHALTLRMEQEGRILCTRRAAGGFDGANINTDNPYIYYMDFHDKLGKYSHIATLAVHARPNLFRYNVRTCPLILNTAHVQGKHITRANEVLDYGANEFTAMTSMAIIISKIAEDYLGQLGCGRAVIAIPVKDGMFMGSCEFMNPEFLDKGRNMEGDRRPGDRHGQFAERPPSWRPKVGITINTYVHANDLSETHRAIFELFKDALDNNAYAEIICWAAARYATGRALSPDVMTRADRRTLGHVMKKAYRMKGSAPPIRPGSKNSTMPPGSFLIEMGKIVNDSYDAFVVSLAKVFQDDKWLEYNQKKQGHLHEVHFG